MNPLIYVLTFVLLAGCYGREPEKTGVEGKPFPTFSMQLTDSISYFNTGTIPTGKASALFYFGPHCPYSRAQMEEIVEDMNRLKNVHFYLVTSAPISAMKKFYKEYQLDKFSNISMGRDTSFFVADYFEVPGVPFMAIFGKDKNLKKSFLGKVYTRQILAAAKE